MLIVVNLDVWSVIIILNEKRKQITVTLFESQIMKVQDLANLDYEGNFSRGLRKVVKMWIKDLEEIK